MSASDKAKNKTQEFVGKAKETVGRVTGDEELEAEGDVDQAEANVKQTGENLKDKLKDKLD